MGQPLTVYTPHQVLGVLNSKVYHWVSDNRIQKYQALFLESSETSIKPCNILNPATFLPNPNPDTLLLHSCLETLDQNYSTRADLCPTQMRNGSQTAVVS